MRNRQIHSALDGVVLILSAILFSLLSLVSCKSKVKPSSTPLPPPPLGRSAPQTAGMAMPSSVALGEAQPVEGGVEGGVVKRVTRYCRLGATEVRCEFDESFSWTQMRLSMRGLSP